MKYLIFLLFFVLETLLAVIQCWQNPSILQRKRTDVPGAVSVQKKSTKLLSECICGLLGSAKYAMDVEQPWLGTENGHVCFDPCRDFMRPASQNKPF